MWPAKTNDALIELDGVQLGIKGWGKKIGDRAGFSPPGDSSSNSIKQTVVSGIEGVSSIQQSLLSFLLHGCGQPDFHRTAEHNGVSALQ